MQKNHQKQSSATRKLSRLFYFFAFISGLLLCGQANAEFQIGSNDSSNVNATAEKKVDYLEQIYFSGDDKDGIEQDILIAIQDIQKKQRTEALTKQMTFLLEVQPKISEAGSTCDALDLMAVGIYNIDAAEAVQQGVKMPSSKAKEKSVDAVAALNSISNSAHNTSEQATGLAWSSILYSGKYTSVASKAGKVAGAASTIGAAAGMAGQAAGAAKQAGSVLKGLGIGGGNKKKTCKDVPQKVIALGEHAPISDASKVINTNTSTTVSTPVIAASVKQEAPSSVKTSQSKITIKAVSQTQLQSILSAVTKITGVTSAESDSYSKNTAVLLISGDLKVGELSNKIVEACKPLKLTVDNYSNSSNTADLILKP